MGAYVERNGKKYYKADDGKLYQDYNAAAKANMNPLARVTRFAKDKIKQVANEGAIPIPSVNNTGYAALGYVKSLAGVAGMPFAIQKNPETNRFLQQTVDASTKSGNTATFNQNISNKSEYDRLGSNIGNKAFGRYKGEVQPNGNVVVKDDYNTNRDFGWHGKRVVTGQDAQGNNIGLGGRAVSAVSALHKGLENVGLTNARPYGTEVTVGNVNGAKQAPAQAPAPQAISQPSPASYAVQAGDTLNAIARQRGVSVQEIANINNISNVDQIAVGQQLKFK